jgi:hypothetical protein
MATATTAWSDLSLVTLTIAAPASSVDGASSWFAGFPEENRKFLSAESWEMSSRPANRTVCLSERSRSMGGAEYESCSSDRMSVNSDRSSRSTAGWKLLIRISRFAD